MRWQLIHWFDDDRAFFSAVFPTVTTRPSFSKGHPSRDVKVREGICARSIWTGSDGFMLLGKDVHLLSFLASGVGGVALRYFAMFH